MLCIYNVYISNAISPITYASNVVAANAADTNGFYFRFTSTASGYAYWIGSYAYKAP